MMDRFIPSPESPLVAISLKTLTRVPLPLAKNVSTVLCIGNFDGVHIGHIELIKRAKKLSERIALAKENNSILCGAWFFSAPTRPDATVLTPLEEKLSIMQTFGLDIAFIAHFPSFMKMSPGEFASLTLLENCQCKGAVCGYNFRYGCGGRGDAQSLRNDFPYEVDVVECVTADGVPVSSSTVRSLLAEGNAEQAAKMLSRPYCLTAPVIKGKMLGRKLGFPTANQQFSDGLAIPAFGVYITRITVEGKRYAGVSNVGVRPTVENTNAVNCETYILDFDGDIYGKTVKTEFLTMLRPETKFPSVEALRTAVLENIAQAREYFKNNQI